MEHDQYDENDSDAGEIKPLPNFIPPEAAKTSNQSVGVEPIAEPASTAEVEVSVINESEKIIDEVVKPEIGGDPVRQYTGVLVGHGKDHYKNDPDEKMNYFVTLSNDSGKEETIWGKGLEESFADADFKIGDKISLSNLGNVSVTVDANVRNENGVVTGTEAIDTHRNQWNVELVNVAELISNPVDMRIEAIQADVDLIKELDKDLALNDTSEVSSPKQDIESAKGEDSMPVIDRNAAVKSDDGKTVTMNANDYAALMNTVNRVNAGAASVDPDELQRVNAALQNQGGVNVAGAGATQGQQQVKTGVQALAEGGMSLLGGVAALSGAAFKGVGKLAESAASAFTTPLEIGEKAINGLADSVKGADPEPASGGVTVLPRLSDYRVEQVEKAAGTYEDAHKAFWEAGGMPDVRKEIEERARVTGISVEDVMEKMKPNGEMAELGANFNAAVAASPDAQNHKKVMDKALEGWGRQHGRAQEELLNPEQEGNPHHDSLKDRLDKAQGKMQQNTARIPAFDGDDNSHAEKLREIIAKVMEKIKEFATGVVNAIRGKKTADAEAEIAP